MKLGWICKSICSKYSEYSELLSNWSEIHCNIHKFLRSQKIKERKIVKPEVTTQGSVIVKEYLKHGKECFEDLDCCESVDDNDDSCPSKLNYYILKEAYLI